MIPAVPGRAGDPQAGGLEPATVAHADLGGLRVSGHRHADPLRAAVDGAAQRLASPSCAQVLQDFSDHLGRSLQDNLDRLGYTPSEYARVVLFSPGFDEPACRWNPRAFAFTVPGCVVVRVCRPFIRLARSRSEDAEAVVIHEVLHTLGLGENPPSSPEITARVRERCF